MRTNFTASTSLAGDHHEVAVSLKSEFVFFSLSQYFCFSSKTLSCVLAHCRCKFSRCEQIF